MSCISTQAKHEIYTFTKLTCKIPISWILAHNQTYTFSLISRMTCKMSCSARRVATIDWRSIISHVYSNCVQIWTSCYSKTLRYIFPKINMNFRLFIKTLCNLRLCNVYAFLIYERCEYIQETPLEFGKRFAVISQLWLTVLYLNHVIQNHCSSISQMSSISELEQHLNYVWYLQKKNLT